MAFILPASLPSRLGKYLSLSSSLFRSLLLLSTATEEAIRHQSVFNCSLAFPNPLSLPLSSCQRVKNIVYMNLQKWKWKGRGSIICSLLFSLPLVTILSLSFSRPTSFSLLSTHPCSCFNCPWFFYIFMATDGCCCCLCKIGMKFSRFGTKAKYYSPPLKTNRINEF